MIDTVNELETLLASLPQIAEVGGEHVDSRLPALIARTLRRIGDRLADIEEKLGIRTIRNFRTVEVWRTFTPDALS